jgi:hypothetical protein
MDGYTDLLDCITHDRGLFFLSVCNKAVVPRWLYASYWRRHRVVLRTRISTLGNACTATVGIPNPGPFASSYEYQFVSPFANPVEAAFRTVKKTYNK